MFRCLIPALGPIATALALALSAAPAFAQREVAPDPAAADPANPNAPDIDEATGHQTDAHEGGEVHAEAEPNILELQPPLAVATIIIFLLLMLVLGKYAWGPLSKALDERERLQLEVVKMADETRAESERLLTEHRALMAQAHDQARGILDEARRDAESSGRKIVQEAQAEAEASKDRAQRDIAQARDQALAEIWTRTADLAVTVAGKVLAREIGPDEQRRLADAAIGALPESPTNGRGVRA